MKPRKARTLILILFVSLSAFIGPTEHSLAKSNKPFTMAWMSDTQYYSESYPYIFDQMTQWLVDNQQKENIKYAFHTGDIVDKMNDDFQWTQADLALNRLDEAKFPYGVLAGNHDVGHDKEDYSTFGSLFGDKRFAEAPHYKGSFENNRAHYDQMSIGGHKFLMLYIGWGLNDEVLHWAQTVLDAHPKHAVILSTHRYLQEDGKRSDDGEKLFRELVVPYPGVQLVLSGHFHGTSQRFDKLDDDEDGVNERTVVQILSDYQGYRDGGNGFMRLFTFQPKSQSVMIRTYSPYTGEDAVRDEHFSKAPSSFSFPMSF
ncbi:metallophosphoesterase [Shouchella shacheensis]|uniref:metallophosphoesterase n=1 Tax=Shouchella shacheensis TaxID=1649580 RepID=UPI00073FB34B|nr:metallophosphoesterase [Shouchella shacheensis]